MALHLSSSSGRWRALALDRASMRSYDADGRLRVALTPISKANICEYGGEEIPGARALGLDPRRIYRLLRDPGELEKAASTFNSLPVLSEHVPVDTVNHQPNLVIGATANDAQYAAPYLRCSIVVWSQDAIDQIESGARKELSCAYRYVADMRSGVYEGRRFDGIMRTLIGNHLAVIPEGRAGPDVVIGDAIRSKQKWPARERSSPYIIRGTS